MKRLLLFGFAIVLFAAATANAQVRPLGLQEIVQSAGTSFIGTVTGTRYGYDANHDIVTYTTFRVDEAVTGHPASVVTIKQLGGVMDGLDTRISHIRYFKKGEKVLVSMYANSELGFSNPVGLDQGVWPVSRSGMVQNVTPTQLDGLDAVLPSFGISANATKQPTAQAISKKNFVALMKSLASSVATEKGGPSR